MKVYELALLIVRDVYQLARIVERKDKDLARQVRGAGASVALNLQEGLYSKGGNRIARFHDSMGSARETMACLHVCVAGELLTQAQVEVELDRIDQVVAILYTLCHKPRR